MVIAGRMTSSPGPSRSAATAASSAALATLTDAELEALERAHETGIDDATLIILWKFERHNRHAGLAN
jgi:hypothetical protein